MTRQGDTVRHTIFGIHISQRTQNVPAVQACLTKYGCSIRTRLGIHDADSTSCSPSGVVLVDVIGEDAAEFYAELEALEGIDLQRMDFVD
jgi:hypothetical protein